MISICLESILKFGGWGYEIALIKAGPEDRKLAMICYTKSVAMSGKTIILC